MKTYQEQKYPCSITVLIDFGGFQSIDCIKGLNPGHALYLARLNWPDAKTIERVVN